MSGKVIFSVARCWSSSLPSEGLNTNAENARWRRPLLMFSIKWPIVHWLVKTHSPSSVYSIRERTHKSFCQLLQWHCPARRPRYTFHPLAWTVQDHNSRDRCWQGRLWQQVRLVKTFYGGVAMTCDERLSCELALGDAVIVSAVDGTDWTRVICLISGSTSSTIGMNNY